MLLGADVDFALEHGGPLTKSILYTEIFKAGSVLRNEQKRYVHQMISATGRMAGDKNYPHLSIDTRVHMLMPGMYPAIPGWHCDHVPRPKHTNGQPDPNVEPVPARSILPCLWVQPRMYRGTQFLKSNITVNYDPYEVWGSINKELDNFKGEHSIYTPTEGQLVLFSGQTLHRAMPTINRGWRYFFRASFLQTPPVNLIRRHTQVYSQNREGVVNETHSSKRKKHLWILPAGSA